MVDFILTEEQAALKELCRNFGEQQLQPIADELDKKAGEDPEGPFPWGVLKEFSSLGLKNLPLPEKWGGADMGVLTHCVLLEELMAAEAGFRPGDVILRMGTRPVTDVASVVERYARVKSGTPVPFHVLRGGELYQWLAFVKE